MFSSLTTAHRRLALGASTLLAAGALAVPAAAPAAHVPTCPPPYQDFCANGGFYGSAQAAAWVEQPGIVAADPGFDLAGYMQPALPDAPANPVPPAQDNPAPAQDDPAPQDDGGDQNDPGEDD